MKFTGHVATAVIAATPVLYFREHYPEALRGGDISNAALLWWTGFFAILPDTDILLQKYVKWIKHRGFASHSLFTALVVGGLILSVYILGQKEIIPVFTYFNLLTAFLAFLAVFMHILGDSLTKTGVPMLYPKHKWHFPYIGGYAAYDNFFLNLIPVGLAGFLVVNVFNYDPGILKRFGKFKDYKGVLKTEPVDVIKK